MPHESWIEKQTHALRLWLTRAQCPMAVSTSDGNFLWANKSFERLLEYSLPELIRPGAPTWKDLTIDKHELATDQELVDELISEAREEYYLQKSYRKKTGDPVSVIIQVIRHPSQGAVEFFMVTVMPVEKANEYMASRLRVLEKLLTEFIKEDRKTPFERFLNWSKENKIYATIIITFFAFLVFGPRVIDFVKEMKDIFFNP